MTFTEYIENSKEHSKQLLEQVSKFIKVAGFKFCI